MGICIIKEIIGNPIAHSLTERRARRLSVRELSLPVPCQPWAEEEEVSNLSDLPLLSRETNFPKLLDLADMKGTVMGCVGVGSSVPRMVRVKACLRTTVTVTG